MKQLLYIRRSEAVLCVIFLSLYRTVFVQEYFFSSVVIYSKAKLQTWTVMYFLYTNCLSCAGRQMRLWRLCVWGIDLLLLCLVWIRLVSGFLCGCSHAVLTKYVSGQVRFETLWKWSHIPYKSKAMLFFSYLCRKLLAKVWLGKRLNQNWLLLEQILPIQACVILGSLLWRIVCGKSLCSFHKDAIWCTGSKKYLDTFNPLN